MSPDLQRQEVAVEARPSPDGVLLVVVGPSGAGKDSVIAYARRALSSDPSVLFVRRVVTRAPDTTAEDHDCLTTSEFAAARDTGAFAVTWEAHGLCYGLPLAARLHVQKGAIAIANGSRAALTDIESRFERVLVVHVTATPEILAQRLAQRSREDRADIAQRLRRALPEVRGRDRWIEIDNSADLAIAGERLVWLIQDLAKHGSSVEG